MERTVQRLGSTKVFVNLNLSLGSSRILYELLINTAMAVVDTGPLNPPGGPATWMIALAHVGLQVYDTTVYSKAAVCCANYTVLSQRLPFE